MSDLISCQQCLDFIADYLAGEVSTEAAAKFDEHLTLCPPCRQYIDSYKRTLDLERESLALPKECCDQMPESLVKAICAARKLDR